MNVLYFSLTNCLHISLGAGGQSDHYAPRFLREPTYTIAKKNRSLTLSCLTDGLPKPLVEWYRDGERVIVDSRRYILDSGALYFRKVINERGNKPDVGFYHCLARNSQGAIASRRVSVTVAGKRKLCSQSFSFFLCFERSGHALVVSLDNYTNILASREDINSVVPRKKAVCRLFKKALWKFNSVLSQAIRWRCWNRKIGSERNFRIVYVNSI